MDGNKYRITLHVEVTNESSVMESKMVEIGEEKSKQPLNYKIIYNCIFSLASTTMDASGTVIITSKVSLKLMIIVVLLALYSIVS